MHPMESRVVGSDIADGRGQEKLLQCVLCAYRDAMWAGRQGELRRKRRSRGCPEAGKPTVH
jgi:hypothetical protein